jgi:hypothetical protein
MRQITHNVPVDREGLPVQGGQDRFRYDAFISYSHAADGSLAPALRNGLHRLSKPFFKLRALNVFRDTTNLAASPGLWPSIEGALAQSRFFILMASPEAAASRWVNKEVDWWCRNRSASKILIILTKGELFWDAAKNDFDWHRTTALPELLRGAFDTEPHWIDFRWARTETDVSLNHPAFRDGVASIAAPLRGSLKDELIGEDVILQRRSRKAAFAAFGAITLFAVLSALAAWFAFEQRDKARLSQSRTLALMSEQKTGIGDTFQGISLALEALPSDLSAPNRPYEPLAETALARALHQHRGLLTLSGHEGEVLSAEFSPNGNKIVTCSDDDTARLWDTITGAELLVLRGHEAEVWSAKFNHDNTRIVTASEDGTARVWDSATGEELAVLRGHGNAVVGAAFSADGAKVVTASRDGTARLWDAAEGKELAVLQGHEDRVVSATFGLRDSRIVTASWDDTARLWDAVSGRELIVMRGHTADLWSAAISPDGSMVVTASGDGTARLWDARTGAVMAVLQQHVSIVSGAAFSPDGKRLSPPLGTGRGNCGM